MKIQTTQDWLNKFEKLIYEKNIEKILDLFSDTTSWRDLISFTWNIITFESKKEIKLMLSNVLVEINPENFQIIDMKTKIKPGETWFSFETKYARCKGHIRLKDGKAITFLSVIDELKGYEEKKGYNRELGTEFGAFKYRKNWLEKQLSDFNDLNESKNPYCLIVGGGQAGLALAARLKQLNVPTIVIDKNKTPGDTWRNRYHSLCLHDPVWYDHMPYMQFPDHWPIFSPKDKIGDWLEMYAKIMEINYWGLSECINASFDELNEEWTVIVDKNGEDVEIKTKHLVFATGMSGMPNIPNIENLDQYKGDYVHSSNFISGSSYKDKNCIVVGSNNSAHDIAAELWEQGAMNVTMIQRSSTTVARSSTLLDLQTRGNFSEQAVQSGITVDIADLIVASNPYKTIHKDGQKSVQLLKNIDKEFYKKLSDSGFLFDFGEDESGLSVKYLRRGSGYYIDVGGSELIINGEIKLESPAEIKFFNEKSIVLDNGKEIDCDLVVFATGYGSMNQWAAKLISQEVSDKVGKCWGLGSGTRKDPGPWEGELRNMWKPTNQNSLWFHGGNLAQARHYSKYLSLQIKARFEKIPLKVYGIPKVNHLN
jgi:putative flavoprotein involved in K+ transport